MIIILINSYSFCLISTYMHTLILEGTRPGILEKYAINTRDCRKILKLRSKYKNSKASPIVE